MKVLTEDIFSAGVETFVIWTPNSAYQRPMKRELRPTRIIESTEQVLNSTYCSQITYMFGLSVQTVCSICQP